MRFLLDKLKKRRLKIITFCLFPYAVCTFTAVIITLISKEDDISFSVLLREIIYLNIGVLAHQVAWQLSSSVFKWEFKPIIKGVWKQSLLGFFLTYLAILLFHDTKSFSPLFPVFLFFEVGAICIIVQAFLFVTKFYNTIYKLQYNEDYHFEKTSRQLDQIRTKNEEKPDRFLMLKANERIEKINTKMVSHITVEDHYCTVVYKKDDTWEQWTLYEKLKNFEEEHSNDLIRINRSTLVNPIRVGKIEKAEGKYWVNMTDKNASRFPLSSSQKHLLEELIPIIT
jgi:hypothetical protein